MKILADDFLSVTELAGDEVTREQIQRLCNRYYWAGTYCNSLDIVEAACGTGQGLGYLNSIAKTLEAGDYSEQIMNIAKDHYGSRIKIYQFDAQRIPFGNQSKDVIILFEALYYLADPEKFITECYRVLRFKGTVLISTANKDLYDFNPSPFSYEYHNTIELTKLFERHGFKVKLFGDTPISAASFREKLLRPLKKAAIDLHIMPKSMDGKKILKRLVFGNMTKMPAEIDKNTSNFTPPRPISNDYPDTMHKVIFCEATKI